MHITQENTRKMDSFCMFKKINALIIFYLRVIHSSTSCDNPTRKQCSMRLCYILLTTHSTNATDSNQRKSDQLWSDAEGKKDRRRFWSAGLGVVTHGGEGGRKAFLGAPPPEEHRPAGQRLHRPNWGSLGWEREGGYWCQPLKDQK